MSLGLGIFLSTLLISLLLLYRWYGERWNVKKLIKWTGFSIGGLLVGGALCIWGYTVYANHPVKQSKYMGVSLGMHNDEVEYVLGRPTKVFEAMPNSKEEGSINYRDIPVNKTEKDYLTWAYEINDNGDTYYIGINFDDKTKMVHSVGCFLSYLGCTSVLGISIGTFEDDILAKLGKPSSERLDGLEKIIDYKTLNVRFMLRARKVFGITVLDEAGSGLVLVHH